MQYKNNRTKNRRRYKSRYKTEHNYKTKKSAKSSRTAIIVGVITFLVLACLVVAFTFGGQIVNFFDNSFKHIAVAQTESTELTQSTLDSTEAATEETKEVVKQDEEFASLASKADFDYVDSDTEQVIFVGIKDDDSNTASVSYFTKEDGKFEKEDGDIEGYISASGYAKDMGPYDDYTPLGIYNIEYAFGTAYDPGTSLEYYNVDYATYWVTDPASVNYNKLVESDVYTSDFNSALQLSEYSRSYKYAIVFDYNRNPVDSSMGCAKFLHVGVGPTYGGVGIPEDKLLDILDWLDPDSNAKICIFVNE